MTVASPYRFTVRIAEIAQCRGARLALMGRQSAWPCCGLRSHHGRVAEAAGALDRTSVSGG